MAGDRKSDRSTSLNVSGAVQYIGGADTPMPPVTELAGAHELSQAFSQFSAQLQRLNALLLNGIPMKVEVHTPAPVNHIHVDTPSITVEPAAVKVEPKIVVEPPFVNVAAPVVRVDSVQTPPHVTNEIHGPSPIVSQGRAETFIIALLGLLAVLSVAATLIAVKLYQT